jgi:hypothetical protein
LFVSPESAFAGRFADGTKRYRLGPAGADRQNWINTAIRSLYEVMNGYSMWKRHIASRVSV